MGFFSRIRSFFSAPAEESGDQGASKRAEALHEEIREQSCLQDTQTVVGAGEGGGFEEVSAEEVRALAHRDGVHPEEEETVLDPASSVTDAKDSTERERAFIANGSDAEGDQNRAHASVDEAKKLSDTAEDRLAEDALHVRDTLDEQNNLDSPLVYGPEETEKIDALQSEKPESGETTSQDTSSFWEAFKRHALGRTDPEPSPREVPEPPLGEKAELEEKSEESAAAPTAEEQQMILALRAAEPRLSAWLAIVLEGVEEKGELLFSRLSFLLRALDAPKDEVERFVSEFRSWLDEMEYVYLDEFRSELQYRLALALELEDEEDERSRLLLKISQGLSRTREHLSGRIDQLLASHGELDESFWEHLEEVFITADMGYEAGIGLVERLKSRARTQNVRKAAEIKRLLKEELEEIFRIPPHITAYAPPEVVLMVGVNGVGKTTTIGKLAHRARMQGRKVMICAADTFRAAAIEQLQVWAERAGALFYSKKQGADPAAVAYEAMDSAVVNGVDLLFVDTAGRLQTKTNLMVELTKIRTVLGKKHPGAPHRTVLVIDATTGQNALSQVKLFKESSGVDELIVTKLDGTAKGGFAIALALQFHLPISYIGLGEKLEDLRPFSGREFADSLIEEAPEGRSH